MKQKSVGKGRAVRKKEREKNLPQVSDRTRLVLIFSVALILRVGAIAIFHTYEFPGDKYSMGFETGGIARSIASGHGFGSPFRTLSGPSAWLAPLYPYFVAGVFKTFGIYSETSAFAIFVINSIFSALTCVPIFLIGRRMFGAKVGRMSAWAWALAPPAMFWATHWVWETAVSAFLLTWLIWETIKLAERESIYPWLRLGALWGVVALTNPSLLSFLPMSLGYPLWLRQRAGKEWATRGIVFGLLLMNIITPWLIRNAIVFHYPIFIRPNLWAEVSFGNVAGADGTWFARVHPSMNTRESAAYDLMGEVQYVQWKKLQVMQFIRANPKIFLSLCVRRFYLFWSGYSEPNQPLRWLWAAGWSLFTVLAFAGLGQAFRRSVAGAAILAWVLLVYPIAYYVTFAFARYKHPIEPLMTLLAVYAVTCIIHRRDLGTEIG
jgi:hypothetical protein